MKNIAVGQVVNGHRIALFGDGYDFDEIPVGYYGVVNDATDTVVDAFPTWEEAEAFIKSRGAA